MQKKIVGSMYLVVYIFRADSTKRCATDIVQFCGFSLRNAIPTRTDTIAGCLLVLTLSEIVVIKAGYGAESRSKQLFWQRQVC